MPMQITTEAMCRRKASRLPIHRTSTTLPHRLPAGRSAAPPAQVRCAAPHLNLMVPSIVSFEHGCLVLKGAGCSVLLACACQMPADRTTLVGGWGTADAPTPCRGGAEKSTVQRTATNLAG